MFRDLKPENLLYENSKDKALIKVIDFGTSRTFDINQKMNQKFGTVIFLYAFIIYNAVKQNFKKIYFIII